MKRHSSLHAQQLNQIAFFLMIEAFTVLQYANLPVDDVKAW